MLKLRDRRTLPASLVSYAGTVLSLLWPKKLLSCLLSSVRANQIFVNTKQWETLCRTLPQAVKGPQPQKGRKAKATVPAHCDKYLLWGALSSVSKQAVKRAKNRQFLLLGLCRTVALSREASEIQLCQPYLE